MTLQTSPPISLYELAVEFGAPWPIDLKSFYRGGPYVPNIPQNYGVPTSGDLALTHFLGATKTTPLACSFAGDGGNIFLNEPAPTYQDMSGNTTATISGGIPPYSHSWSRASGSISWNVAPGNSLRIQHSARVLKNQSQSSQFVLTVSDSAGQSAQFAANVSYSYDTDM